MKHLTLSDSEALEIRILIVSNIFFNRTVAIKDINAGIITLCEKLDIDLNGILVENECEKRLEAQSTDVDVYFHYYNTRGNYKFKAFDMLTKTMRKLDTYICSEHDYYSFGMIDLGVRVFDLDVKCEAEND